MTAKNKTRIFRILYVAVCGPIVAIWIATWILSLTSPRTMKDILTPHLKATALVRQQ